MLMAGCVGAATSTSTDQTTAPSCSITLKQNIGGQFPTDGCTEIAEFHANCGSAVTPLDNPATIVFVDSTQQEQTVAFGYACDFASTIARWVACGDVQVTATFTDPDGATDSCAAP